MAYERRQVSSPDAGAWSEIGRVPPRAGREIYTISGRAFCVSGRSGNIAPLGPQGFFNDDTRFLSGFRLLIDGVDPQVVDATSVEPDEAVFFLRTRAAEQDPYDEPGLIIRRHRYQGPSLHEDIIIKNRTGRAAAVIVELEIAVDFADLLDVHLAGPVAKRRVRAHTADGELLFTYSRDGFERETSVFTSEPATIAGERMTLNCVIESGAEWRSCIDIVPIVDGIRLPIERSCRDERRAVPAGGVPRQLGHVPRLRSSADALEHLWEHSLADLAALEIRMGGVRAFAAGIPWYVALFGRDSILTSIEATLLDPDAAFGTALLLAELQGTRTDPSMSEEPGKILHEVRFGERSYPRDTMSRYYGSVDTTPLWCMQLEKMYRWGVDAIRIERLLPNLRAAVEWINRQLEIGEGLLVYEGDATRLNNQGWKDSHDSMVDAAGTLLERPIAVVEAQGYVVAALRSAARLEHDLGDRSRSGRLRADADALQERIEDMFWRPELGTFDMALGKGGRPANTVSSNAGHLLWAEAVSAEKAAAVAESLCGDDLWSGWGIRTLAESHTSFHPLSYHRGSVWPHDTMLSIAGLISYGFVDEALEIAGGLLAAAAHFSYELPELFSGLSRGEVSQPVAYPTSSSPQAWAAAVPIYLTEQLLGLRPDLPAGRVVVDPHLPDGVELRLDDLRLGSGALSIRAEGRSVQFFEVPAGLDVVVR
jgi:glycogen debranching enzyme